MLTGFPNQLRVYRMCLLIASNFIFHEPNCRSAGCQRIQHDVQVQSCWRRRRHPESGDYFDVVGSSLTAPSSARYYLSNGFLRPCPYQACTTRQRQEATAAYIKSCSPLSAGIIAMQQADDWPTAPLRCAGTGRNGGGCCSRVGCVAGDILTSPR